jgi:hypothetical protein
MATKGRKDSFTRKDAPMPAPSEIGRGMLRLIWKVGKRKGLPTVITPHDLEVQVQIESRRNGNAKDT